jgi:hypothetical protein
MHTRGSNVQSTVKKAVKFGDKILCHVHEVESFRDVNSMWWTKDEISDIERESKAIIYFLNNVASTSESENANLDMHSIRGLEKKTEIGAWEMYETQRDARNAVLCLQDKQRKLQPRPVAPTGDRRCSLDSGMQHALDAQEAIAKVYQAASLKARRAAYEAGLNDFLEAKRDGKPKNSPSTPAVPTQKVRKVVPITSEPMVPKWGRKISMPLMDPSENSESSSKSTVTKEVESIVTARNGRTGVAPKIRSSLSPLKKRRPKPDDTEAASERSRNTQIEAVKPKRSASLRRKAPSADIKQKRCASLHINVPSEKAVQYSEFTNTGNRSSSPSSVAKSDIDKPERRRTASPRRKVSITDSADLTTATTSSSRSQTRKKISTLSGDILKLQKALADFESGSLSCDENVSLKNDSGRSNDKAKVSTRSAAKKSTEKQVPNPDATGENHRIRVIVKKKRRPSKESSFRNCPSRSASHESKGNQTADTAVLLDLSNSSIESFVSGYIENSDYKADSLDSRYHQNKFLSSPPSSSDSEMGGSGTILSNILKRMGGDRKSKVTSKTQCVEA